MQVTHDRLAAMGGSVHFYDVETGGTEVVVRVSVGF
jgi:signal transduction histidine kinase